MEIKLELLNYVQPFQIDAVNKVGYVFFIRDKEQNVLV
jgi:hypothetical protein